MIPHQLDEIWVTKSETTILSCSKTSNFVRVNNSVSNCNLAENLLSAAIPSYTSVTHQLIHCYHYFASVRTLIATDVP